MSIKVETSSNFEKNLDSETKQKTIKKNLFRSEEVLFKSANSIAPFDPTRREGSHLRQDTSVSRTNNAISRIWNKEYAEKRYNSNKKNPQTIEWIEKGEIKTRNVREKIMREDIY